MCEQEIKRHISELIRSMMPELEQMVDNASSSEMATKNIMNYISGKVTGASRGYLSSLYSALSKETLKEPIFQNPVNANKFYSLYLDKKIVDIYRLDVKNLNSYKDGVSIKEIKRIYITASGAVGSMAVGALLFGALSGIIDIPFVAIIEGAVVCGVAGGLETHYKVAPKITKASYKKALMSFLGEFEKELENWIDSVTEYYNKEVEMLKKTL